MLCGDVCHARARPCLSMGWALGRCFAWTFGTAAVLAQRGGGTSLRSLQSASSVKVAWKTIFCTMLCCWSTMNRIVLLNPMLSLPTKRGLTPVTTKQQKTPGAKVQSMQYCYSCCLLDISAWQDALLKFLHSHRICCTYLSVSPAEQKTLLGRRLWILIITTFLRGLKAYP